MIDLERVVAPNKILVVDDKGNARRSLAKLLRSRGYRVALAETGSRAVLEARSGKIGVVLMDNVPYDGEMDGVTAAQQIQRLYPLISFVFVTASAADPSYKRRIYDSGVRVGGLIDKPVKIDELEKVIEAELEKLRILCRLEEVRELGGDPKEQLKSAGGSLSAGLIRDLLADLERGVEAPHARSQPDELRPLAQDAEEEALMETLAEIDAVYEQIRSAVAEQKPGEGLKEALRPLRSRLEQLQERQADALERRVRRGLHFDPQRGRRVAERAEKLLQRK